MICLMCKKKKIIERKFKIMNKKIKYNFKNKNLKNMK